MAEQKKRVPLNTSRETRDNPLIPLAEGVVFGPGESIYRQEAQGQKSFVNSETLPTKMVPRGDYGARTILKAAGVKFLGEVEGDPIFQYVELPTGWKKVPTDHPMWSKLLDDKGRERANIFYKAASYDRSANLNLTNRFDWRRDHDREEKEGVAVVCITDGGNVIHTTKPIKLLKQKQYEVWNKANEAAIDWLDKHYPGWTNPTTYPWN